MKRIILISFVGIISLMGQTIHGQSLDAKCLKKIYTPIRTIDPQNENYKDFKFLKKDLKGVEIVMLGEQAHGDGSTFAAKSRLVKFLHEEMDFDVLVFESSILDCYLAWQDILAGNDPYQSFGKGVFKFWTVSTYTTELIRYLGEKVSGNDPLILAGFDMQFSGAIPFSERAKIIEEFLNQGPEQVHLQHLPHVKAYMDNPTRFFKPKAMLDVDSLYRDALFSELNRVVEMWDQQPWAMEMAPVSRFFVNTPRLMYFIWNLNLNQIDPNVANIRDQVMAENLAWLKEKVFPGKKLIVWGANSHFGYRRDLLEPGDHMIPMGNYLKDTYKEKLYTLAITSYNGLNGSIAQDTITPVPPASEACIETKLSQAGFELGFINLRSPKARQCLDHPFKARIYGYEDYTGDWTNMADGLLFIKTMEPNVARGDTAKIAWLKNWTDDINQFARVMTQKHINAFSKIKEEDFKNEITRLIRKLPILNDAHVKVELLRIAAKVGDSHSGLRISPESLFPFTFSWFSDGIFAVGSGDEQSDFLGLKLIGVGAFELDTVIRRIAALIPHENWSQLMAQLPVYLVHPDILFGLGIIESKEKGEYVFLNSSGQRVRIAVPEIKKEDFGSFGKTLKWVKPNQRPITYNNSKIPYWFKYMEASNSLLVNYSSCRNDPEQSFKSFTKEIMKQVNDHHINKLILDLRDNGGGNSAIFSPMLQALKNHPILNQKGNLYVLIGRKTFSSAILNAVQLKQMSNAIFVGEPTGGKPNHFGEIKGEQLNHSGISVSYSTKYFNQSVIDTDSFLPDYEVTMSYSDYLSGIDPAFEFTMK